MNILIIFDHPYGSGASENILHNRSYSAALLAATIRGLRSSGHRIDLIDLHKDGFNPVMSASDLASWRTKEVIDPLIADYQQRLLEADHLIFIFPIWWEGMPAMMKVSWIRYSQKESCTASLNQGVYLSVCFLV